MHHDGGRLNSNNERTRVLGTNEAADDFRLSSGQTQTVHIQSSASCSVVLWCS